MKLFWKSEVTGKVNDVWIQEVFWDDGVDRDYAYIHAIAFVDDGHVLLGHHSGNGHYGVLGGKVETGETFEQTLRREVMEEGNAKVLRFERLFIIKQSRKGNSGRYHWQVAGWADVRLLPGDVINDPGGDVNAREVVPIDEVPAKLKWSEGEVEAVLEVMLAARAKAK